MRTIAYAVTIFIALLSSSISSAQVDFFGDNIDNVNDDATLAIDGAGYVVSAVVGGRTYIVAAGYAEDGISVFELTPAGLSQVGITNANILDDATLNLSSPYSLVVSEVAGRTFVTALGDTDAGLSIFELSASGLSQSGITNANISDDATLNLSDPQFATAATIAGRSFIVVSSSTDGGLSMFEVTTSGLSQLGIANANINDVDNAAYNLAGITALTTAMVGGQTYIVAANDTEHGLSVFELTTSGLSQAGITNANITDDATLNLNGAASVTSFQLGAQTFVVVGGSVDSGLSMFELTTSGLTQAGLTGANISDDATVFLDTVQLVTSLSGDGRTFIVTGTSGDNGLSAFEVSTSGFTQVGLANANIADDATVNLNTVFSVAEARIGSEVYLVATSEVDSGLSVFRVGNFPLALASPQQIPVFPPFLMLMLAMTFLVLSRRQINK
ncbi:hypothetical protein [uncultured Pseudoteredinibacter sp.]|uniref:hypothetical protein n=1 Tax=uncultured Pseudoteredinibacter sp. TaxID=1641701 RepID=UPI00262996DA|nr:hypothetical protein [uncultured Pseudoteredinibacter sp.]